MNHLSACSGIEAATQGPPTRRIKDRRGHRNGRLVVVGFAGMNHEHRAMWFCRCDCGGETIVQSNNLDRKSGTKSCGCLKKEAAKKRIKGSGVWNEGRKYPIRGGEHVYSTRHSWAKAAIRKFGAACQRCGWNEARCDVHHKIPRSKGGENILSNALVICPNCHRVEHERGKA